jgi:hypothetical protein
MVGPIKFDLRTREFVNEVGASIAGCSKETFSTAQILQGYRDYSFQWILLKSCLKTLQSTKTFTLKYYHIFYDSYVDQKYNLFFIITS